MVIGNSLTLCVILYCIVGYSGYFSYGNCVSGDILESYPKVPAVAVVRIVLAIALAFSYPLQAHPCRKCLVSILNHFGIVKSSNVDKLDWKLFYLITYCIAFGSFGISMAVENLSTVIEIVGSIGSPIISFVIPGLFYYKMTTPKIRLQPGYEIKRRIAFGYVVFGCLIIPFGLTMQIIGIVIGDNDSCDK